MANKQSNLVPLNKAQMQSIKRKAEQVRGYAPQSEDSKYRSLRRRVQPMFGSGGGVMLFWQNMWLGIESDGYTHS
jgi:hypothetical protein